MLFASKNIFFSKKATAGIPFTLDYLVIAGGGSGGKARTGNNFASGGAGAGGYLAGSVSVSSLLTYSVTIGAGGAVQTNIFNSAGNPGTNSSLVSSPFSVISTGGGGGGQTGGSGGGVYASGTGAAGVSGQGFNGGNGPGEGECGAGGGAGEAGATAATTAKGGDGLTWLDGVTRAGGGGGSRWMNSVGGALSGPGGAGGGGVGANTDVDPDVVATAGAVNTGSGGGVGWPSTYAENGGAGGSGVVKVRYAGTPRATGGTITQSGGFTYHQFTSSGTLTFTS